MRVVRNAPGTILSSVRLHGNALSVNEDFCVLMLTIVHPKDDGHVMTLITIEEGEVIDFMSIRIGANSVVTVELMQFSTVPKSTRGRSSLCSYTSEARQSNECRESE